MAPDWCRAPKGLWRALRAARTTPRVLRTRGRLVGSDAVVVELGEGWLTRITELDLLERPHVTVSVRVERQGDSTDRRCGIVVGVLDATHAAPRVNRQPLLGPV